MKKIAFVHKVKASSCDWSLLYLFLKWNWSSLLKRLQAPQTFFSVMRLFNLYTRLSKCTDFHPLLSFINLSSDERITVAHSMKWSWSVSFSALTFLSCGSMYFKEKKKKKKIKKRAVTYLKNIYTYISCFTKNSLYSSANTIINTLLSFSLSEVSGS